MDSEEPTQRQLRMRLFAIQYKRGTLFTRCASMQKFNANMLIFRVCFISSIV